MPIEKENFFIHWFNGFEQALEKLDGPGRETLLGECGRACSRSYTKQIYADTYAQTGNIRDFMEKVKKHFPELQYELEDDGRRIVYRYTHCACDLVKKGLVKAGLLCDCSRLSLLENWEAVAGRGNVRVELGETVLRGGEHCELTVTLGDKIFSEF